MAWVTSKIQSASTVQWSNGANFDGYILMTVVPPSNYSTVVQAASSPRQKLPTLIKVPVKDGVINQQTSVPQQQGYEPPNCKYTAAWYDENDTLIVAAGAAFAITADPYTITVPTLTAPV